MTETLPHTFAHDQYADQYVRVEQKGKILLITLDRDEQRNALNAQMCQCIANTIERAGVRAQEDDSIRLVVIRGAGKAFCAGADLGSTKEQAATNSGGVYGGGFHDALWAMLRACVNAPIPVVADIHGPAVGAGSQLALACDVRIVGQRAWFKVPAAELGFALDAWTINRARELLGGAVARNMLLAATTISAQQAVESGFALAQASEEEAWGIVEKLSELAPLAVAQLKGVLNAGDSSYAFDANQQEKYQQCWDSADAAEAKAARKEKRAPVFERR
ncbi:enoyl-CoA hydratase [Corynebacterium sp. sy039]|uniref:enoyl-CoA hydratase n=1 Tax=Corynebacterium sp. sy039 TaxID=2599641 RepID=UPI0011B4F2F1|nr:enoyl-CoA hydratase [Corynebacterium sp. sy039]QDZ42193.1 enoyl-CoA hydratase [Corynebacterium sp. sy039]